MKNNRGDVVLVLFPDSNLQTYKPRPALVVQSGSLQTGLPQTIVAMITSNIARAVGPSRISVSLATPSGQRSGLKTNSVIVIDNLATVRDNAISRTLGTWPEMGLVDAALKASLGL